MNTTNKVIFNTAVLYIKIVISMAISLVSVPIILRALGQSDYGIYNLIAGVISMLSFLNASMAVSTQRFMSVSLGEKDENKVKEIYNSSIVLHLFLGLLIVLMFEAATVFLFKGKLNIDPARMNAVKLVYQFLVVSTFFTVITVPYNAALNAKENMLVFSILGIIESVLKLVLAICLISCPADRLVVYGAGIAGITILSTFLSRLFVKKLYKEFVFKPRTFFSVKSFKEMFAFASWNTLGSLAMIGRNQGIAIVINLFFGTIANAAYGIANQINGVLGYFSATFQKALNPQLMQSEGMNDRERLIRISFISSKFSVIVLALFALPLIVEMPYVLKLWLGDVPEYTTRLAQLVLILSLVYQYSVGLMSAIQAVGNIKVYFIVVSILTLSTLPISYVLLKLGLPLYSSIMTFIVVETITLTARLLMAHKLVGINMAAFFREVVLPTMLVMIIPVALSMLPHFLMQESFLRLTCVVILFAVSYLLLAFEFILSADQRHKLLVKFKLARG